MAAEIVRRIFSTRPLPPQDASQDEFKAQFDAAVADFEEGGFMEQTKLPPITSEIDLVDKLHDHRGDLVVVKFWKRGCLPCMGLAEMYKAAEKHYKDMAQQQQHQQQRTAAPAPPRVVFYSVNTRDASCLSTVAHQLVDGTPSIQLFHQGRQIGDEVLSMNLASFIAKIDAYAAQYCVGSAAAAPGMATS